MDTDELFSKYKTTRELALALAAYTSASIIGPLFLFGGIGFFLDRYFGTKPIILIISLMIAFIFTNIFIFKKAFALSKMTDKQNQKPNNKDD